MRYYALFAEDTDVDNWVFYDSDEEGEALKERFRRFQCSGCGKLDKLSALKSGDFADVTLQTGADFFSTNDDVRCISICFVEACRTVGATGFGFIPLPAKPSYGLYLPEVFAPTDRASCGCYFSQERCEACGRFLEARKLPTLASIRLPDDPRVVFSPEICAEGEGGQNYVPIASELVVQALQTADISGLCYFPLE